MIETKEQDDLFLNGLKRSKEIMGDGLDAESTHRVVNDYLEKTMTPRQASQKLPLVIEQLKKSSREDLTVKTLEAVQQKLVEALSKLEKEESQASTIENGFIIYRSLQISVALIKCFKDSMLGTFNGYYRSV